MTSEAKTSSAHPNIGAGRDERGAVAIEAVLLIPVIVVIAALVVASARLWVARAAVEESAHRAARAATVAGEAGPSLARARETALVNMSDGDCQNPHVSLDASALHQPPGVPGAVHATVSCTVAWSDLLLPGLPGSVTVTSQASSVVDTYRSR